MFGKPEWFTYRIFGWGLRIRSWQGLAWLGAWMGVFGLATLLPAPARGWVLGLLGFLALADTLHIMSRLKEHHDERDRHHQLLIERNCSFAAVAALAVLCAVEVFRARLTGSVDLGRLLPAAGVLLLMGLVKAATTLYLRLKG